MAGNGGAVAGMGSSTPLAGTGSSTAGTGTGGTGMALAGTGAAAGMGPAGAGIAGVGAAGVGGATVMDEGGAGAGSAPMVETTCTIDSTLTMSSAISTVGIVEISTDLAGVDGGHIEFGMDGAFDMKAPIDPAEPSYRTLLLGMKPQHEYQYRIVVTAGNQFCTGPDESLMTGAAPATLRAITVDRRQPDKVARGFMIMGSFLNGPVVIVDSDGDYVWWASAGGLMSGHMSYDGKSMWIQAINWGTGIGPVPGGRNPGGNASIHRISMDGTQVDSYGAAEFGDATHDFDVTADGSYLFADINGFTNCAMKIVERTADGQRHDVFNLSDANTTTDCLVNAMRYWPADDSITISDLPNNSIIKLTRTGQIQWILNGPQSTFTQGDAPKWIGGQHGHHFVAPDRVLVFNNGTNPYTSQSDPGNTSKVYEIQIDPATNTANLVWQYDGGLRATVFGDVQRLPNGNTLVDYGNSNAIHEVDPDGNLVQSFNTAGISPPYVDWRSSLYGPPDR